MARKLRFSLRSMFRRFGRGEQRQFAADIKSATPPKVRPDGRPMGGSLSTRARQSGVLKASKWGYVLRYSRLGAKLRWFVYGTVRQVARDVDSVTKEQQILTSIGEEVAKQFGAWERTQDRRSA